MAGIDAGSIYSEVRIRLSQLDGDLKGVYARLDQLEGRVGGAGKSFKGLGLAGVVSFAAIGKAVKDAVATFAGFEQSIANVASVSGGTTEEMQRLEEAAKQAGETTRFTASQAADAMYFLASAGLDASESISALDGVLQLAGATQSDLASTSASVTATLSQYSLEAEDATRISNVFAAAIGNSQANMDKLSNAFRQVGPVAGAFGQSVEETTGALQILFNAGYQGEQAGTILRNMFSYLADSTGPVVTQLEDLGIAFDDVNPQMNSTADIIGTLSDAGLTAAQAMSIFGNRAGPGVVTLLAAGRGEIEKYTEAVTDTNAAAEAYAIQNDTLAGDVDILKSNFEAAQISLGEGLAPALRDSARAATELLKFLTPLLNLVGKAAGVGIRIFTAAVGTISKALGALSGYVSDAVDWFGEWITKVSESIQNNEKLGAAIDFISDKFERVRGIIVGTSDEERNQLDVAKDLTAETQRREQLEMRTAENAERVSQAQAEQLRLRELQLRLEDEYLAARAEVLNVIDSEKTEIDKIREQIDYLNAHPWNGGFLEEDRLRAIEILNKQLETLQGNIENARIAEQEERQKDLYDYIAERQKERDQELADAHARELQRIAEEKQARQALADFITSTAQQVFSTLSGFATLETNQKIAELDRELNARLKAAGLAEETEVERLQRELDEAVAAGDTATAAQKADDLERATLTEEYEKKKAQVEYEGSLTSWKLQLASTIAAVPQAALNAYLSAAAIPLIGYILAPIAAAAATGFGLAQVSLVNKSKPQPPSFEFGGIVPGSSFTGDQVDVKANSGEMFLTREQQSRLFDMLDSVGGGSQMMTLVIEIDGKPLTQTVVDYIDNGKVRFKAISK